MNPETSPGKLHPVLARQLRRAGIPEPLPPGDSRAWLSLLERVSTTYREAEDGRYLLERSLDVSSAEMRDLNARLSSERNRFQTLLAAVADGICAIDAEGLVTWANPAAARLLGLPLEQLQGYPLLAGLQPAAPAESVEGYLRAVWNRPDGGEVSVSYSRSTLPSPELGTESVVAFRDVTREVEAERQLRMAREAADSANRAKSQFLANMSHEIRTPMNGVIAVAELMLETNLDAEQRNYAEVIHRSGDSLLSVINDILDFSKVEAGKEALRYEDFEIRAALEDIVDSLASNAAAKGVEMVALVAPQVPDRLRCDKGKLRQTLTNLISNAVKFTDRGSILVRIAHQAQEGEAARLRAEVIDTGIGIGKESMDLLFQPFSQLDGSETRRHGGTGLGLAISRHFVHMMGGEIDVASGPGEGSRFSFTFLALKPLNGETLPMPLPPMDEFTVIVADDNAHVHEAVAAMLDGCGANIAYARSVEEMLRLARRRRERTFLMLDFELPGVEQVETVATLLSFATRPGNRVYLMGSPSLTRRKEGWPGHRFVSGILAKPLRAGHLHSALLSQQAVERALASIDFPDRMPTAGGAAQQILVVEDSSVNRVVAREMLRRLGFTATYCANGVEAVAAARLSRFAAVLMDCQMPEMDGYDATREIRSFEANLTPPLHTPIIALTANALAGDRERCLEAGMDDYLTKPLRLEGLRLALERWVPVSEPGRPVPAS